MTITIVPFTIHPSGSRKTPSDVYENEEHVMPINYCGINLDDEHISYVSSKELAEKTKLWIEKWFKNRL